MENIANLLMTDLLPLVTFTGGAFLGLLGLFFVYRALRATREKAYADHMEHIQTITRLETEKAGLAHHAEQHVNDLTQMEEKFRLQFENLANRIFEEKATQFKKNSEEGLGQLLAPLKERLQEFQKKVDDSFGTQAKEQFSLKEQIERIVLANEKITTQAESLTNALKGNSKTQGDWGEVILDTVLQESGLRKDQDYIVQGAGLKMKGSDGKHLKPDVIVKLPENKHIVVDSKVSLTHYERYFSDDADDVQRVENLKLFLKSIRTQISDLSGKNYQDNEGLGTPDYVLMFIPIEGAYALAVQQDQSLQEFAWKHHVSIVCASTLFVALRTIANLWRMEQQNRNTVEIAKQGGALYDKIMAFLTDMEAIGTNITKTNKAYETALTKLSTGQGNILTRTEKLKQLGVKTTKTLPKGFFNEADNDQLEDLSEPENLDDRAA